MKCLMTRSEFNNFRREGMLTEDEELTLITRLMGWSRFRTASMLSVSVSTVDRTIKTLKEKYRHLTGTDVTVF